MGEGHLFIISGPSGAGKGTLVKELLRRVPDLWVSVSATTRAPRPGEKEGIDYFFLTPAEFEARVSQLVASDPALSEYVRELIRKDKDRLGLRGLLLAGATSAPAKPVDEAYFDSLRRRAKSAKPGTRR